MLLEIGVPRQYVIFGTMLWYDTVELSYAYGRVPNPGLRILVLGGQRRHAIVFHTPFHTLFHTLGKDMEQLWRVIAPLKWHTAI